MNDNGLTGHGYVEEHVSVALHVHDLLIRESPPNTTPCPVYVFSDLRRNGNVVGNVGYEE